MLKSIKITKLFGRFDYELSFSNEGIMIITGPNGYGKSTILRIINNFCNDGLEKVLAYAFKKLVIVSESALNLKTLMIFCTKYYFTHYQLNPQFRRLCYITIPMMKPNKKSLKKKLIL